MSVGDGRWAEGLGRAGLHGVRGWMVRRCSGRGGWATRLDSALRINSGDFTLGSPTALLGVTGPDIIVSASNIFVVVVVVILQQQHSSSAST